MSPKGMTLSWKSRQEGVVLGFRKSRLEGGLKNDPIRRGGGGVWIFSGITHLQKTSQKGYQ